MGVDKTWKKVMYARSNVRFTGEEIVNKVFDMFMELHGDRKYGDDSSIVGGLAFLGNVPVTVIIQQKGKTMEEKLKNRNGMVLPEGYRKALRLMKQAEKFKRPIICIIDTPGAYPGKEAEKRGQAEAIARNMFEMAMIKVPIITIIIGEGGSGGALALCVANCIMMLENAIFSVVSPEVCASILWKDSSRAAEAAHYLKMTANDLKGLDIIDKVIMEESSKDLLAEIKYNIMKSIEEMSELSDEEIQQNRIYKFRNIDSHIRRIENGN